MIATSGFLTALECIKFVFGWGSAPTHSWFEGTLLLTSKGKGEESEGKGKTGEGRGRKGRVDGPLSQIPGSAPAKYKKVHSTYNTDD